MTEILFYTFADDRLDVARRVAAKAYGQGKQVMIYAPDAAVADGIDRLLWTTPPLSFIPHCRDTDAQAAETPVLIGANPDALRHADYHKPSISKTLNSTRHDKPEVSVGEYRSAHANSCVRNQQLWVHS